MTIDEQQLRAGRIDELKRRGDGATAERLPPGDRPKVLAVITASQAQALLDAFGGAQTSYALIHCEEGECAPQGDSAVAPAGLYAYDLNCPEEGVIYLGGEDEDSVPRADPAATEWLGRAAVCALGIIRDTLDEVKPDRGDGTGLPHLRWMAEQLVTLQLDSPTKACRWLGYLQGSLVAMGLTTLDREKRRNLNSKEGAPGIARHEG